MPTILTHPVVPLVLGLSLGRALVPTPLLLAGVAAAIVPDFDVIAFGFDIPYASPLGHRGFTHSFAFAVALALLGTCAARSLRASQGMTFVFLLIAAASHGVLDSFTNGGRGIAFLWPWSAQRFFAPWRIIEVSPIGVSGMLTQRGVTVLVSELFWIWLPGAIALGFAVLTRRVLGGNRGGF
jgi:inner membrane protein